LLMRRWGGCGMVPSGTYYSQVPSTVLNDRGSVDGHALDLLPEMVERYATAVDTVLIASPGAAHSGFSES
ncbi:MAG: glycosyltransferase family 2 protein, partial [Thermomicrobiales bacterium]|nr:glycosyltransferase family 2 protein [Thermomicrobiales bacterium]